MNMLCVINNLYVEAVKTVSRNTERYEIEKLLSGKDVKM